jgi:N-methylhydantoinase A
MSMRKVIIPPHPGLFSALGLLVSDVTADFVETVMLMWDRQNLKRMNEALSSLSDRAKDWFQRVEAPRKDRSLQFSADLRYLGQNFELNVPVPSVPLYLRDLVAVAEDFHQAHKASYGHSAPGEPIQAVNFRLRAVRALEKPDWTSLESAADSADGALKDTRQIVLTQKASGGKSPRQQECKVYERSRLRTGHLLEGPSLIQEKNSTTFVGPSWRAKVDRFGNLVITRLS